MSSRQGVIAARAVIAAVFLLLLGLASVTQAQAQVRHGDVWGRIVDGNGVPIPGVSVYLVNPEFKRDFEWVTDPSGEYRFLGVPLPQRGPLWIEVFWGPNLMFRDIVPRLGGQPPIVLR